MLKKAVSYLQSVANEDDIPELLQAGFEVRRLTRRRTGTAPAAPKVAEAWRVRPFRRSQRAVTMSSPVRQSVEQLCDFLKSPGA